MYGGKSSSTGEASGNYIFINGDDTVNTNRPAGSASPGVLLGRDVIGGGYGSKANTNTVTISGIVTVGSKVYGGKATRGEAIGNIVSLSGDVTVDFDVYGGYVERAIAANQASNNEVSLSGNATVGGSVYGGRISTSTNISGTEANNNSVTITGGTVGGAEIAGGWGDASSSVVNGNTVTISGATIQSNVYGGYSGGGGEANGNAVSITGGAIASASSLVGGYSKNGTANANEILVNVTGFTQDDSYTLTGGQGAAEASENSVTLQAGTVSAIYGGHSSAGDALENHVTITGGQVNWDTRGGFSNGAGSADDNIVEISGGSVGSVYGGWSLGGAAGGNQVIISGGTVRGANGGTITGGRGDGGDAINNTVTIMGSADVTGVMITGGFGSGDVFSGNTFNLKTKASISQLSNFEYLNFYLPGDFKAGDTLLEVTGTAYLTENSGGTGRSSIVNVGIDGNSPTLKGGDQMVLIDAGRLIVNSELNETAAGYGKQGSTLDYLFNITAKGDKLLATVQSAKVDESAKALSEGFVSSLATATQGSDLAAGEGLGQAVGAASITGMGTFSATSAGSLRYKTGSSVDVNSISIMIGLAFGNDLEGGRRLTFGPFFEYGTGSYDTHNSFAGSISVNGKGDTDYIGGGILGRLDFAEGDSGHFYTEFSARMGRTNNEYNSSDLLANSGQNARYDSSSSYFGLHASLGYIWNLGEKTLLDLYGKYFWTHQGGDSVKLSTGDPIEFEDADSHRLRAGARLSYQANDYIAPYVGAAYEHEFDGKAQASTYGYAIEAPDMKGGTGIGELGFTLKPSSDSPVSFDLGVQGYTGLREGVTGSLMIKFEF